MRNNFKYIVFWSLLFACAACTNTGSVNILITNSGSGDCKDARVSVTMEEVNKHLVMNEGDTLFLLNETNQTVPFTLNSTGDTLSFVVPVVRKNSQKNYSLNAHEKTLTDNLLRFRTASIEVRVGDK